MRVLVACEYSNTVRDAFLERGHDAWSCDVRIAIHPNPNYKRHIRGDVRPLLRWHWDLVIAHPPCTYLSRAGARWLHNVGRVDKLRDGAEFFMECLHANSYRICVENPIMLRLGKEIVGEPTQVIQPYQFGHPYSKATCLWLKNLPLLVPTNILTTYSPLLPSNCGAGRRKGQRSDKGAVHTSDESEKTFYGIAQAMADQWGGVYDT